MTGARVWDAQKKAKFDVGLQIQAQYPDKKLLCGPLAVTFEFHMLIAESLSDKKRHALDQHYHTGKPDLDNMIKFYLDVATGILFANDCTISQITATKRYSLEPYTLFEITTL